MSIATICFLALLSLIETAPAVGAIYKWVDDRGVTHYTETPPVGHETQEIELPARTPRGPDGEAQQGEASESAPKVVMKPVPIERALSAPPELLAQGYLWVTYILTQIPVVTLNPRATVSVIVDDKRVSINQTNAALYTAGFEKREGIYAQAIEARGFQQVAGEYRTKASGACQGLFSDGGTTTVQQDGFKLGVKAGGTSHRAIIVQSSIVLEGLFGPAILFRGKADSNTGALELTCLQGACSGCVVHLFRK